MSTIEDGFSNAGLLLKIASNPFGGFVAENNAPKIFQMTIRQEKNRHVSGKKEYFEIFPGDKNTRIRVLDLDKEKKQVVLNVHEPKRTFKMRQLDFRTRKVEMIEHTTPDYNRAFLVGMDQTHYFIAQLPKIVPSVEMAHRILKPHEIRDVKNIKRQGEWFFVPVNAKEERSIDEAKRDFMVTIQKNFVISGRPKHAHVADEAIKTELGTFVFGKIKHPDHYPLFLHKWCKFVHNNEKTETFADNIGSRAVRIGWVD